MRSVFVYRRQVNGTKPLNAVIEFFQFLFTGLGIQFFRQSGQHIFQIIGGLGDFLGKGFALDTGAFNTQALGGQLILDALGILLRFIAAFFQFAQAMFHFIQFRLGAVHFIFDTGAGGQLFFQLFFQFGHRVITLLEVAFQLLLTRLVGFHLGSDSFQRRFQ